MPSERVLQPSDGIAADIETRPAQYADISDKDAICFNTQDGT